MAFDDLDLEFEDEEEVAKKKKLETMQVDGDLHFTMPDPTRSNSNLLKTLSASTNHSPAPAVVKPSTPSPAVKTVTSTRPVAVVTKIEEARAAKPFPPLARPVAGIPAKVQAPSAPVMGSSALQQDHHEMEGQMVLELREQMRKIEFDAEVKVAVAEFKTSILSELLSDTKLMQHQIEQLLVRIHAKHPDMKQEVLMIKKILADFNAKKRK